jgi:hypothetical protein
MAIHKIYDIKKVRPLFQFCGDLHKYFGRTLLFNMHSLTTQVFQSKSKPLMGQSKSKSK